MKRKTKIFCLILCAMLVLCCAGCKGNETDKLSDGSQYVGEWKANSISQRSEDEIVYTVVSVTLSADGSCVYQGRSAHWEFDKQSSIIRISIDQTEESVSLTVAGDGDSVMLRYRTDTYYRAEEFTPKDRETVSPPASESYGPDEPEPAIFE